MNGTDAGRDVAGGAGASDRDKLASRRLRASSEMADRADDFARREGFRDRFDMLAQQRAVEQARTRAAKATLREARDRAPKDQRPSLERAIKGDFRAVWPGDADAWRVGVTGALRDMNAHAVLRLRGGDRLSDVEVLAFWRFAELALAVFGQPGPAQVRYEERTAKGAGDGDAPAVRHAGLVKVWRGVVDALDPDELQVLDRLARFGGELGPVARTVFAKYHAHAHAQRGAAETALRSGLRGLVKLWGWTDPAKAGAACDGVGEARPREKRAG